MGDMTLNIGGHVDQLDPIAEAGGSDPLGGQVRLRRRKGDGRDASPTPCRAQRQFAPARADLEQPRPAPHAGGVQDGVDLAVLGLVEGLP